IGMCGPFACAAGDRVDGQLAYHAGRITTYAALGALTGALGSAIPGPPWLGGALGAVLLVWFSLVLADVLPEPKLSIPGLGLLGARAARGTGAASRFLLGLVNGLLPCGLVWATLSLAVASADPWTGALVMAVFGLGTVPALAAATFGLRKLLDGSRRTRRAMAALVLATGLASLAFRTGLTSAAGITEAPSDPDVPPCHAGH
ncbi:MAG: sulfite exporter TauE/SafE family protein, partial [Myxococcales bacterium]|nr:sulfite exporter TauE/SafE family protein [Myxococcales bacterium]